MKRTVPVSGRRRSPDASLRRNFTTVLMVAVVSVMPAACHDDDSLLRRGRDLTQQFYDGDLAPILTDLTPQVTEAIGGESGLKALQEQFRNQLGSEVEVVDEQVSPADGQMLYRRVARYDRASQDIVVTWAFDDDGRITGFLVQPRAPTEPAPSNHLDYQTRTPLQLPFADEFTVHWGGRTLAQNYHAASRDQRFAYDLVIMRDGRSHAGDGRTNEDYWCFGRPILSPGDGIVATALDGVADNVPGELNSAEPPGNHVIIDHGLDEYSLLAHFRQHTVRVAVGERVMAGDTLGECGNSGRSTEPHLHYHLQNTSLFGRGEGLPVQFLDYVADDVPVARGEPVRGQRLRRRQ